MARLIVVKPEAKTEKIRKQYVILTEIERVYMKGAINLDIEERRTWLGSCHGSLRADDGPKLFGS